MLTAGSARSQKRRSNVERKTETKNPSCNGREFNTFLNAELMAKLHVSALQNGRLLVDEIEFRLERDFAREALGPRRSIPIRRRKNRN
jgi:hypothetical protein